MLRILRNQWQICLESCHMERETSDFFPRNFPYLIHFSTLDIFFKPSRVEVNSWINSEWLLSHFFPRWEGIKNLKLFLSLSSFQGPTMKIAFFVQDFFFLPRRWNTGELQLLLLQQKKVTFGLFLRSSTTQRELNPPLREGLLIFFTDTSTENGKWCN